MNNFEERLRSIYNETKKIKLTTTNNEKHIKILFKNMVSLTEDIIDTLPVIEKSKLNKSLDETLDKCKIKSKQKKELKTTTNKIVDHFLIIFSARNYTAAHLYGPQICVFFVIRSIFSGYSLYSVRGFHR